MELSSIFKICSKTQMWNGYWSISTIGSCAMTRYSRFLVQPKPLLGRTSTLHLENSQKFSIKVQPRLFSHIHSTGDTSNSESNDYTPLASCKTYSLYRVQNGNIISRTIGPFTDLSELLSIFRANHMRS
jgi:hypothetical protein